MQQTDFREIPPGLQDGCGIQLDGLGQVKLFSKNFKISLLQIIRTRNDCNADFWEIYMDVRKNLKNMCHIKNSQKSAYNYMYYVEWL